MRSSCLVLALALTLLGCQETEGPLPVAPSPPPRVTTPSGARIELPIEGRLDHEVEDGRESFRTDDGVVWSVQTISTTGRTPHTLQEIAVALTHRVELGEVEGELTHRDCTFASRPAQCIEGWQRGRDGGRVLRRGALLAAGPDVVWVSLAVREDYAGLNDLAAELASDTRVGGVL